MVSYHHVQYQKKLMTESWENLVTAGQTDVQRNRQRWTREILSLRIQPNCRKIRTRKTPYLGNSYAVTFTQHIPEFSQVSTLPYSTVFPNLRKLMTYCCKLWENCSSPEKQYCYFLGAKELPWMTCIIKLSKLRNHRKKLTWTSLFYLFHFISSEFSSETDKVIKKISFCRF